jgi:hypothetical protein
MLKVERYNFEKGYTMPMNERDKSKWYKTTQLHIKEGAGTIDVTSDHRTRLNLWWKQKKKTNQLHIKAKN